MIGVDDTVVTCALFLTIIAVRGEIILTVLVIVFILNPSVIVAIVYAFLINVLVFCAVVLDSIIK